MAQPVTKFEAGSVTAAVWESRGKKGPFMTVQVSRSYRDPKSGEWKRSDSFSGNQLGQLMEVAQKAREYLQEKQSGEAAVVE